MFQRIKLTSLSVVAVLIASVGATTLLPTPASAYNHECPELRYGSSRASCVKDLQRILNSLGPTYKYSNAVLTVDGGFGPKTLGQVRAYQHYTGYLQVDGQVGPKTWSSLCWNAALGKIWINPTVAEDAFNAAQLSGCYRYAPAYYVP